MSTTEPTCGTVEWHEGQRVMVRSTHPYGPGHGTIVSVGHGGIHVHLDYPTWAIFCQADDLEPLSQTGRGVS